jgi:hypothetical protein
VDAVSKELDDQVMLQVDAANVSKQKGKAWDDHTGYYPSSLG